jgi:organic radical activating enzyme
MTNACNYNCFYCSANPRNLFHPKEKLIYNIIDFIFKLPNKNIELTLSGGEITAIPNILEYFKYIVKKTKSTNKKISISMLSNFKKSNKFYEDIFEITKPLEIVRMYFSFHREFVSSDIFMPKYIEIESKYKDNILPMGYMIHNKNCIGIFRDNIKKYPEIKYKIMPIFGSNLLENENLPMTNNPISNIVYVYYKNNQYYYKLNNDPKIITRGLICPSFSKVFSIDFKGYINNCITMENKKNLHFLKKDIFEILKNKKYIICNENNCLCHPEIPKIKNDPIHKFLLDVDFNYIKNNFTEIK